MCFFLISYIELINSSLGKKIMRVTKCVDLQRNILIKVIVWDYAGLCNDVVRKFFFFFKLFQLSLLHRKKSNLKFKFLHY
jgi:hypothetical protein